MWRFYFKVFVISPISGNSVDPWGGLWVSSNFVCVQTWILAWALDVQDDLKKWMKEWMKKWMKKWMKDLNEGFDCYAITTVIFL